MGHKVSPISTRLPITKDWQSKWFATKDFRVKLEEDLKIRRFLEKTLKNAALEKVQIHRLPAIVKILIYTARPGIIIGRGGQGIERIEGQLKKFSSQKIKVEIIEVKTPELSASLIAQNVAIQISKRVSYKRAAKQALDRTIQAGAKGIKITISGRLRGAEIARSEKFVAGSIPLSSLKKEIDFAKADALTTYGIIGIKVWINRGEREDVSAQEIETS